MLVEVVRDKSCAPILLRLAWHDAGTYDKERESLGYELLLTWTER